MSETSAPVNYWLARCAADAKAEQVQPERLVRFYPDDVWFVAGLLAIFVLAMLWAWSPVAAVGVSALGYSAFWTLFWGYLIGLAWTRTR